MNRFKTPGLEKLDLDAIETRCEAATPADHMKWRGTFGSLKRLLTTTYDDRDNCRWVPDADTQFVAHAREDLPTLVAALRELRRLAELTLRSQDADEELDRSERLIQAVLRVTGSDVAEDLGARDDFHDWLGDVFDCLDKRKRRLS